MVGNTDDGTPDFTSQLTSIVKAKGAELGFDLVKVAAAVSPPGFHPLIEWIGNGYHADMEWIERRKDAYEHPNGVMENTRSVIVVAMNYHNQDSPGDEFKISRYAHGTSDYHTVLKRQLKTLTKSIHTIVPNERTRAVVDTAPLLERDFARLAGIGWFGKNTMLISREIGSWFFIGAILTTAKLVYDAPFEGDFCGSCDRCMTACPTNAFPEPGVLDANRCISYLTIERRDKSIPIELRDGMGNWIFGCDICQDVCPWNRFAPSESPAEFLQRPELREISLQSLLNLDYASFQSLFKGTPLERTGRDAIVRNVAIAAGNQRKPEAVPALNRLLQDSNDMVRNAATWALKKISEGRSNR